MQRNLPRPRPPSLMPSAFFTTDGGDIVLRAGPEPNSKHDFCVHKTILSLASPVFKDMFAFPQPLDQTLDEQHQLPVVDIPEAPEVFDIILRLIYPGAEPPKITGQSTLSALLFTADKYDIRSVYPTLRENLKAFLSPHSDHLWVYIMACRFGFSELVKEAAKVSTKWSLSHLSNQEELRHVSSTDLFRLNQFVLARERDGLARIRAILEPTWLEDSVDCPHNGEDVQGYYSLLGREVEEVFVEDPCVGVKDLSVVLDEIPDPPPGCDPLQRSANFYSGGGDYDHFDCPIRPMTIRRRLKDIADSLSEQNLQSLDQFFGRDRGSV